MKSSIDRASQALKSGISRREFLKRSLGASAVMLAAVAVPEVALAAEAYKPAPRLLGSAKEFQGVTVTVAGIPRPLVSGPMLDYGKVWGEKTGASVELVEFPFGDLINKLLTSFAAGIHVADILQFGAVWMADIMGGGHLLPVPAEMQQKMSLEDLVPINRTWLITWGGTMYGYPYDGDYHMLYYRRDAITDPDNMKKFRDQMGYDLAPPATWTQYNDIAKFFNNWDWNKRGKPSYGSCEEMARVGRLHWFTQSRAAAYAKHPEDPDFFFDRDTMKPRINNPGWVRAVQNFVDVVPFGPPGRINFNISDMRAAFVSGDAALVYEWGDIASEELKKDVSVVNGLVGSSILPGAEEVYNSKTKAWDKIPNHRAPILNFGGWTNGVASTTDPSVQAAAMDFCAYMGSVEIAKKLAIQPDSGINPGRYSQLGDVSGWVTYGLKESDTVPYLNAIRDTYTHPNVVVDLRVPGGSEYTDAVQTAVAKALAGQAQPQEAMDEAASKWEEITDRLGRDSQMKAYVESMTIAKSNL